MLHRREKLRNAVNNEGVRVYVSLGLGAWKDEDYIIKLAAKYQLIPYWSPNLTEGDQANRIRDFERAIYPIWARLETMFMEKDKAAQRKEDFVKEEDVLHAMDVAIHGSGHRPDRAAPIDTATFRKREKLIDQAKAAKGEDAWYHK